MRVIAGVGLATLASHKMTKEYKWTDWDIRLLLFVHLNPSI